MVKRATEIEKTDNGNGKTDNGRAAPVKSTAQRAEDRKRISETVIMDFQNTTRRNKMATDWEVSRPE